MRMLPDMDRGRVTGLGTNPQGRFPGTGSEQLAGGCGDFILPAEFLNPAGGIHQFLLTGKKGVARRTNFHFHVTDCGTYLEAVAASTSYCS